MISRSGHVGTIETGGNRRCAIAGHLSWGETATDQKARHAKRSPHV